MAEPAAVGSRSRSSRSGHSRLELALLKLRRCSEARRELAHVWPAVEVTSVWWDNYYQVFTTERDTSGHHALFGSHFNLRSIVGQPTLKSQIANARKLLPGRRWVGPRELEAPVWAPADAVLVPPGSSKHGILIASRRLSQIIKLNFDRREVNSEVEVWPIIEAAGIAPHVPAVLEHGHTADGGRWMLTQLVPNTEPLDRPLNPFADREKIWRQWLRWRVLPVMQRFYEAAGPKPVEIDELLAGIKAKLNNNIMPDALLRLATLAERARLESNQDKLVITTIHKDLVPGHVHRNGHDWWIIDWGSIGRSTTSIEVFRRYFWRPVLQTDRMPFWDWLRGSVPVERLPANLRADVTMYLDWYSRWQNTTMTAEALRCELLVMLLKHIREIVKEYELGPNLQSSEGTRDLPAFVRSLRPQLRALGVLT